MVAVINNMSPEEKSAVKMEIAFLTSGLKVKDYKGNEKFSQVHQAE
jgi:hypothetical protein